MANYIDNALQQTVNMFNDCAKIKLLWTNASPGSAFAAQTVSLTLSGYEAVIITFTQYTERQYQAPAIFTTVGQYFVANYAHPEGSGNYAWICDRVGQATTTGVVFQRCNGVKATGTGNSVLNTWLIPYQIFGIKY